MGKVITIVFLFCVFVQASHNGNESAPKMGAGKSHWGSAINTKESMSIKQAIAGFGANKTVLVKGQVEKVCEKKGCWMVIKDKDQDVRVTFKKYAFFVPASVKGKTVEIQGELVQKEVSVAEQRHYLEDEGAGKKKIDAVKVPKKVFRFVATGVRIAS